MRKTTMLCLLIALCGNGLQAQQQHLYGTTGNEILTDAHYTTFGGGGHVLAAPSANYPSAFSLTRTKPSGVAASSGYPYFSNVYRVSDVAYTPGAQNLKIGSVASTEFGGDMYLIAGSYTGGDYANGMGVFFQKIGDDGLLAPYISPDVNVGYYPNDPSNIYKDIQVKKILNSSLVSGDRYILGSLITGNDIIKPFVVKINTTGALLWSHIYQVGSGTLLQDQPFDMVEVAGTKELLVVGEHLDPALLRTDAFLMTIECNTGTTSSALLYGEPSTDEGFRSIKASKNSNLDPKGAFILGGYATKNNQDFWFLTLDHNKKILSSKLFDYNKNSNNVDYCNDIIEHSTSSNKYEYYLAGYTHSGFFGQQDMVLIHTDENGNSMPKGQITYGTTGDEQALRLSQDDDGVTLYGTSVHNPKPPAPLGGEDMYLVRADFEGISECNYQQEETLPLQGPGARPTDKASYSGEFIPTRIYTRKIDVLNEVDACHICDMLKPPLVAHWNFTNGSLVDDVQGLTGVIHGSVTLTNGQLPGLNAYRFDGISGYIQVPYDPVMNLQSWTLTALVRPEGFYAGTCQANRIVGRGNELGPNFYALELCDNAFDADCYVYSPANEVPQSGAAGIGPPITAAMPTPPSFINLNQWYCIWASYDAVAGNMDIYKDAVLQVSIPWSNQYGPPSMDDLFIGSSSGPAGPYPYFFNGVIDDIAIFGGPLICPLNCADAAMGTASKKIPLPRAVAGDDINVSPNPTIGNVTLITTETWSGGTVTVLNATGQTIARGRVNDSGKTIVDLASQAAGIYLLRIEKNGQYTVKKVIRQ